MMVLNKNKEKLVKEDTTTRRNPDSASGIYLTAVKVEQFKQVDYNSVEKE